MNNPYTSRGPLQDASMFFGRTSELSDIGAFLQGNQSISIVGPRKIGKTSLMLHLMRAETRAALGIKKGTLFVYMDCQAISSAGQDEIFAIFCTEVAEALHASNLEPEPSLKAAVSKPTWSSFEYALRKLSQRGLRVVLMLDEFEQLTINPHVDVSFYNALRSAAGRLRLAFLTGSAQPLIELTYFENSKKILSSPFFNIFAQVFLGLLSQTDARSLIRCPMEAAGKVVSAQLEDFIYQLAGGHPLALQIACFHAWESPENLSKIELQSMQELEAHFQYYWHNLSVTERDVLRHPSEGDLEGSDKPALRVVLRNLIRKCLLVQSEGMYKYSSKAWAEFVLARQDDLIPISPGKLPSQTESEVSRSLEEQSSEGLQERTPTVPGSNETKRTIREVLRASLPEAIGGLAVVLILGIARLINVQPDVLIEGVKSLNARISPLGLVLIVIGILVAGIAARRFAVRWKQSKLAFKKSGKGILTK